MARTARRKEIVKTRGIGAMIGEGQVRGGKLRFQVAPRMILGMRAVGLNECDGGLGLDVEGFTYGDCTILGCMEMALWSRVKALVENA